MRISVLGMGNMGRAFAARAIETGNQTTVWNRTPGRVTALVASGATEADSPTMAAADADAVLVVLADDAAVLDVCLGDHAVLASLEPDAVFANISTVSPETARRLAEVGPQGRVLDAPVMGSPTMIAGGLGRFLIGGPATAITAVEPLWNDLGSGYMHCGPVGTGATMKILANSLLITGVASLAEVIATARRQAIPDEFLRPCLPTVPWSASPAISGWTVSSTRRTRDGSLRHWPVRTFASPSTWPNRPELVYASDRQPKLS
jgi:3-hydroxyisobutyrate dehydrogenase-like beta-hydroxyacid dehydrogenase